ncbi:Helicase SWF/SNF-related protein [Acididesulfobacillus acetoxydans]|uniref:Helicase SWF/SNF-related protein n=1 Tax=Acididesulfobacillus acetoxydans TaxID=1561005 RepID=A0A8S0Y2V0_9FIRM|nr:DEAD/DEAH box helicase [Acididesulfobacillus acetoxydans]CAA7601225.1 Helicase SWF/SNF-related protein [Acididesulfobacillus acetoxydans]CEJ08496.1 SWI/SNF-related matrix-associated actin-dependent regulator of chromatin sub A member 5 [Acididesulfobacillus acetoxydans]
MASGTKELIVLIRQEGFELDWEIAGDELDNRQILWQEELYEKYREDPKRFLLFLGFAEPTAPLSASLRFLKALAASFVKALAQTPDLEFLREQAVIESEGKDIERMLGDAPYMNGAENLNPDWLETLWRQMNEVFCGEIKTYRGSVAQYFAAQSPGIQPVGRVFFHLVESKEGDYPFAFLATYSSGAGQKGKSKHLPLKNALVQYKEDNKKLLELLATVNKAAEKSELIADFVDSGEIFHPLGLSGVEAYTFLREIPLYEGAGILCRMPNWWKTKANSLRLSVTIGNKVPSRLGAEALIDFDARLSLGEEEMTVEELRQLLSETEGLAFIKGKWVEVDHEKLKQTLAAYERALKLKDKTDLTLVEAMRFQLQAAKILNVPQEACELEISNGEWLSTVVTRLTRPEEIKPIAAGGDFQAQLRTYQDKGLSWLNFMKSLGLGACLADDMGLGKTIQVIALLNYLRTQKRDKAEETEKALLVVPASLIANWVKEIGKFAPSLTYCILHPSGEKLPDGADISSFLRKYDIFITTYGMLLRYAWLAEVTWDSLILDEAQAIKNPGTKQTRAVKKIKAAHRIALTGTPVENRLTDLWSLFDFLNKGLLGSAKEFSDFAKKLQESRAGYSRLKKVVSPFILRRLKTDKTIIADLPEKIEMKAFAALTKKQAALYNALVREIKRKLEAGGPGIERKGLILASLLKFKQICNHPDQYLGQDLYAESESGKYARLREICETIYDKRERVLVFTQFKEITGPLQEFLARVFQHQGLVLHGETPVSKRQQIVEKFQGPEYVPFLVLSIKAGGVGLNLTAANHVIHFDRWWNPAVENQATDRAFRIGQLKNVVVHKFITKGTIEEKIDLLIEEKSKLSQEIIPDIQENWLTGMDNRELMELFRLS